MSGSLNRLTVPQLRELLTLRGMSTSGTKRDLVERVTLALESSNQQRQLLDDQVYDVNIMETPVTTTIDDLSVTANVMSAAQPISTTDDVASTSVSNPTYSSNTGKSPYQLAREQSVHESWSAHEPGEVNAYQIQLQQRAKAIQEKYRLQHEREQLLEKEYLMQKEIEEREWRDKQELIERERNLRIEREQRERSIRLDVARQRRMLQEQEELLMLSFPGHELGVERQLGDDRCTEEPQVLSPRLIETQVKMPVDTQHLDDTRVVNVRHKPIVSHMIGDVKPLSSYVSEVQQQRTTDVAGGYATSQGDQLGNVAVSKSGTVRSKPVPETVLRGACYGEDHWESLSEVSQPLRVQPKKRGLSMENPEFGAGAADVNSTLKHRGYGNDTSALHSVSQDESFKQLIDLMNLPKPKLTTFSGDPMQYHFFMSSFNTCIDNANIDDAAKLNRLFELCEGKARAAINPCALGNASEGYRRAKQLLKQRFGDEYVISEAWVNKITSGAAVKGNSIDALQAFTDDVRGCVETLRAMGRLKEVDTRGRLVKLMQRLPENLQTRWRKKAVFLRDETGEYPDIIMFLEFLDNVTREASDPIFGIRAGDVTKETRSASKQPIKKQGKSFATESQPKQIIEANPVLKAAPETRDGQSSKDTMDREMRACPLCNGQHPLYACGEFKKMPGMRRLEFVREKKLCFRCLKSAKHTAKFCKFDRTCGIDGCPHKHSRFLHAGLEEREGQSGSAQADNRPDSTAAQSKSSPVNVVSAHATMIADGDNSHGRTVLPVVAVRVESEYKSAVIHALIDTGSDHTYCSPMLLDELQIQGEPATFNISTLSEGKEVSAQRVSLSVSTLADPHDGMAYESVYLPNVYAIDSFPALTNSIAGIDDVQKFSHLKDLPLSKVDDPSVKLLIGQDNPDAMTPLEFRRGSKDEPFAVRYPLGWTVSGPLSVNDERSDECNLLLLEENDDEPALSQARALSVNDKKVLRLWDESVVVHEGHYMLPIPLKKDPPELPNNKYMAEKRLQCLKRKMDNNREFAERYRATMQQYINAGYAERIDDNSGVEGMKWYIPHHAVINAKKPDKLRIVFDCAAEYEGVSINKAAHRGPDLTNKLLGVLIRFREKPVVIIADVEAMYHQVKVPPAHRDVLRFLWYDGNDVVTYRMCVHVFGGVWSASAANYALKRTAEAHTREFPVSVTNAVERNFYVDDLLQSVDTIDEAARVSVQLRQLLARRGFNLTKWMSSSREVLQSIPPEHHAKNIKDLDLERGPLPKERALGVVWLADDDNLQVSVGVKKPRFTKRGLLSHYSTVYDPLGMVAPFVLIARLLYRTECKRNKAWDDELEPDTQRKFEQWLGMLPKMEQVSMARCVAAPNMTNPRSVQLHHFCDASENAYAAVSYLRVVQNDGDVHCAFVFGKSKLSPGKGDTIPRLELEAAVLSARNHLMLASEMTVSFCEVFFWTDSTVVLGWLKNEDACLTKYVDRRVASILEVSSTDQWRYVPTHMNPADVATRGTCELGTWLSGPDFLHGEDWPTIPLIDQSEIVTTEEECIGLSSICVAKDEATPRDKKLDLSSTPGGNSDPTERLLSHFSCLMKLKRSVVWFAKFCAWLRHKNASVSDISVHELRQAEHNIIKCVQKSVYQDEYKRLAEGKCLLGKSRLFPLEPYIDEDGLLRVGGRLKYADIDDSAKNQMLLPAEHHVTTLLVRRVHIVTCMHGGVESVLSALRTRYWIPRARRLIRRIVRACVICRRLTAKPMTQKMADLPPERLAADQPPFACTGIDCFGPIIVNRGRGTVKRYGIIFTCMTMRAVHLEVLPCLSADAFLNGLRRFICRRGKPDRLRSDNGTNFVGAYRQLADALNEPNGRRKLRGFLHAASIDWQFNPPAASHFGGAWERLIRSVRRAFNATIRTVTLNDYELQTVICEVEAVVNNRPITAVPGSKDDAEALTPSHLLAIGRTGIPPPVQGRAGDYYQRRWRFLQYLVDRFWRRWYREYLPTIQHRRKWITESPNAHDGDVVIIMDEQTHRNQWPLGRVTRVNVGRDGRVRSCEIKTAKGTCTRPISKLCLLESCDSE